MLKVVLSFFLIPFLGFSTVLKWLPIYIEDNHQGTFFWVVEHLSLNEKSVLILFDYHHDATQLLFSDIFRKAWREKNMRDPLQVWRKTGEVQCYNWIEPLLPDVFSRVIWVHPMNRSSEEWREDIKRYINQYIFVDFREIKDLSSCYELVAENDYNTTIPYLLSNESIVISIDLDFFTGKSRDQVYQEMKKMYRFIVSLEKVEAVTVAISRPYLNSDEEASFLLGTFLDLFSGIVNASFIFEPYLNYPIDTSKKAQEYRENGKEVPYFSLERVSTFLRHRLLRLYSRLQVNYEKKKWTSWMENVKREEKHYMFLPLLYTNHILMNWDWISRHGYYYKTIRADTKFYLQVDCPKKLDFKIKWWVLNPLFVSFNILRKKVDFATNAPSLLAYMCEEREEWRDRFFLNEKDVFSGYGVITLRYEVYDEKGEEVFLSPWIFLSCYKNETLPGLISGLMNRPFVYANILLSEGENRGPELMWGSDCVSFVLYGVRKKLGKNVSYVGPSRLPQIFSSYKYAKWGRDGIAIGDDGKPILLNQKNIDSGVIVSFFSHVAVVWSDANTNGILDKKDLVIHHLEDYSQIVTFDEIKKYQDLPFMVFFLNQED